MTGERVKTIKKEIRRLRNAIDDIDMQIDDLEMEQGDLENELDDWYEELEALENVEEKPPTIQEERDRAAMKINTRLEDFK
jgi:peptidoglycan hydrolase CwlO-like protein